MHSRSFVKKLLNMRVMCKEINSRPCRYPNQSDLPKYWFGDDHSFTAIGVDNDHIKKVYLYNVLLPELLF